MKTKRIQCQDIILRDALPRYTPYIRSLHASQVLRESQNLLTGEGIDAKPLRTLYLQKTNSSLLPTPTLNSRQPFRAPHPCRQWRSSSRAGRDSDQVRLKPGDRRLAGSRMFRQTGTGHRSRRADTAGPARPGRAGIGWENNRLLGTVFAASGPLLMGKLCT